MFKKSREFMRSEKESKRARSTYNEMRLQGTLQLELKKKLEEYLKDNDEGLFEVHPSVIGDFLSILDESLLALYDYEQVDENKFIFYNKGIGL